MIVRSNGTPVFFLANAVDDVDMGITHVLRGEDLIDSTHRVLALRRALGVEEQPVYAHLPLIVGPGGAKLSKRHGAVSVEEYQEQGFLADAMVNYLALLGWAPEDDREVLDHDELVAEFDLGHINHSAAAFDAQKLEWMNAEHIRRLPVEELAGEALPFAKARYGERLDIRAFEARGELAQERSKKLVQIADQAEFLFVPDDELEIAADAMEAMRKLDRVDELLGRRDRAHRALRVDPRRHRRCSVLQALEFKSQAHEGAVRRDHRSHRGVAVVRVDRDARTRVRAAPTAGGTRALRLGMRLAFKIAWRVALALFMIVFVYLAVTFFQVWRAARRTRPARRTRSWCSVRRSTTAGRRRCSRPGSTTRSSCTTPVSRRSSSSPAAARRVTGSPKRPPAPRTCTSTACPTTRSCARRAGVRPGSRSRPRPTS